MPTENTQLESNKENTWQHLVAGAGNVKCHVKNVKERLYPQFVIVRVDRRTCVVCETMGVEGEGRGGAGGESQP